MMDTNTISNTIPIQQEQDRNIIFKELLNLLKLFDEICRKENIEYWLDFGTLLGAIRHGGFIPWDDDIDVSMTYQNYLKFFRVCDKYLPKHIRAVNYNRDRNSVYISRGYLQNTKVLLKDVNGSTIHPFIDIFYYTALPKDVKSRWLMALKMKYCSLITRNELLPITGGYIKKVVKSLLNLILKNNVRKREKWNKYITEISYESPIGEDCNLIGFGLSSPWDYAIYCVNENKCIKKDWVFPLKEISFEGLRTYGPAKPHEYLTVLYGDYMTPPPKGERKGTHISGVLK